MRKAILSFGLMLMATLAINTVSAQTATTAPVQVKSNAILEIDKEVHDYGTIEKGANGECVFTVTNTGTDPLHITRCKGSCGCTVPQCPKDPIQPGASAKIKVKYDTKRLGPINKTVSIESNASNSAMKTIRIKGNIKDVPTADPMIKSVGPVEKN